MIAFSVSEYFDELSISSTCCWGLEVDLHEVFDRLLLLDRRGEQVDPQNVVVTQFVEQLDVGVADDLVELLEVDGNHGFGSLRLYSAAPRRTRLPAVSAPSGVLPSAATVPRSGIQYARSAGKRPQRPKAPQPGVDGGSYRRPSCQYSSIARRFGASSTKSIFRIR